MRTCRCQRGEKAPASRRGGKMVLDGGIVRIPRMPVSHALVVRVVPVNLSEPPGHAREAAEVFSPLLRREIGGSFARRHVGGELLLSAGQLLCWPCAPPFISYDRKMWSVALPVKKKPREFVSDGSRRSVERSGVLRPRLPRNAQGPVLPRWSGLRAGTRREG